VREERGVEVDAGQSKLLRPVDPALEVPRLNLVPLDRLPAVLEVDRMEVEPMTAGD